MMYRPEIGLMCPEIIGIQKLKINGNLYAHIEKKTIDKIRLALDEFF